MTRSMIEQSGTRRYTVVLTPDADEGGYVVTVPALPGCVTQGETVEEALVMAKDAIGLWIEALEERGQLVPAEPSTPIVTAVQV